VRDPSQVQLPHGSFDIYAKGRVFHEGRPVKDSATAWKDRGMLLAFSQSSASTQDISALEVFQARLTQTRRTQDQASLYDCMAMKTAL
jgi:hypothetical protein